MLTTWRTFWLRLHWSSIYFIVPSHSVWPSRGRLNSFPPTIQPIWNVINSHAWRRNGNYSSSEPSRLSLQPGATGWIFMLSWPITRGAHRKASTEIPNFMSAGDSEDKVERKVTDISSMFYWQVKKHHLCHFRCQFRVPAWRKKKPGKKDQKKL